MADPRDRSTDSLSTLNEWGGHITPHPADVKGFFRRARSWVYSFLIFIFLALPWAKIDGEQAILLNIPERKFSFFGLHLWGHDVPLVFFVFAILALVLFLATALWGRVWCGWGCPQTVFIDHLYRRIERFVEGSHLKRMKLDQQPMNMEKLWKRSSKWFLYFFVSAGLSHCFVAYFVGAKEVLTMTLHPPSENWTTFLVVNSTTVFLMFNFGWFREQFCTIMCPYGRFQSVLLDENSLTVLYDETRGEPRRKKGLDKKDEGDCVNCYKCVSVCPTGIDIRNGVQMECIACTACIDICDEVMEKVKKPVGLIRYETVNGIAGKPKKKWTARTFIYIGLILAFTAVLVWKISHRNAVDVFVVRAIETPYQQNTLANGDIQVVNHFRIHLKNQSMQRLVMTIKLPDDYYDLGVEFVAPMFPADMEFGEDQELHLFVKFPKKFLEENGKRKISFEVRANGERIYRSLKQEITLIGPRN